jgi:hypothetical protein
MKNRCSSLIARTSHVLLILVPCLITIASVAQSSDTDLKELNRMASVITTSKRIGVMDTVLFQLKGRISRIKVANGLQHTPNIIIRIENQSTGHMTATTADENGDFQLWGEKGTYSVEISSFGMDNLFIKKLNLGSGEIRLILAILGPGKYYESIQR